jgi:D-aspartate ligase
VERLETSVPVVVLKVVRDLVQHGGLGISRSLGRLGVPVYWFYADTRAPGTRSRYVRGVEKWSPEDGVEKLLEIGARLPNRPLLIPIDDRGAVLVHENRDALQQVFRFPQPDPGAVAAFASKRALHETCLRLDLPTPGAAFPQSRDEAVEAIRGSAFPLVLKRIEASAPAASPTAPSVFIAANAHEALDAYASMESPVAPNVILQEYVPGGPESVWMFNGYFGRDDDCLVGFTGKKLRQHPPYTGSTTLGVCEPNDAVEQQTLALAAAVGYRGVLDIGWRYDARDGSYKLLDANPRIGGSFRLFVGRGGLDVVRALYRDMTEQDVPRDRLRAGRKWLVEPLDVSSSLRYHRDGKLSIGAWLRSFVGVQEAAWFARDDLRPFVHGARAFVARALRSKQPVSGEQPVTNEYFADEAGFWDEMYEREDVYSLVHRERQERAIEWVRSLGLPAGARALDAGCGAGHASVALARAGLRVDALDPVENMVQRARANAREAGVADRVEVRRGDVHELPFEDGTFSLAVALGVLPWVESPARAVTELARVLAPGGTLVVSADNRRRLSDLVDPRRTPLLDPAKPALKRALGLGARDGAFAIAAMHTRGQLRDLLATAGLEVEAEQTIGFGPFTVLGRRVLDGRAGATIHGRLQALADRGTPVLRAGGAQVLVLARKTGST